MKNEIIELKYGNTNTFLIKGEYGNLLVDTDYAGTIQAFYKEIKRNNIRLSDITYVIATHYHPDHIGLISKLGINLLLIDSQVNYINFSDKIFCKDQFLNYKSIDINKATIIDINNSRDFLKSLGIAGEIISTTSHSVDSISIILDNGHCIVGDLEPYEYLDAYDDNDELKNDWNKIFSYNPKIIYYSHNIKKEIK